MYIGIVSVDDFGYLLVESLVALLGLISGIAVLRKTVIFKRTPCRKTEVHLCFLYGKL